MTIDCLLDHARFKLKWF